ncbi:hypothetical protein FRC06_003436 [Ceratobasidium sp. 370]|nr:hypothetical protein FRC06_003436 [Ceratobasidium sp. 370]
MRQSSLYPAPRRATADGDSNAPTTGLGVTPTNGLAASPSTSNGASPAGSSVASPGSTPDASATSTPNASSASVQYTTSSSRPRTRDTTPTSPSPVKQATRLPIPRTTSPPPRVSEELLEDLDHYVFSPQITDTDCASVELMDEHGHESEEAGQWLSWPVEDGQHPGSGSTPQGVKHGRRPPPSPTNLPWMAGNVGRRPTRRDVVYPSGVHIIPMAALGELARLGSEEESAQDAIVARTVVEEEVEQPVELAVKELSPLNPPLSSIEVVIYTLGTFNMASTIQMVQFYLLMRHAKRLALQYKAVIDDQAGSRVDLSPISIHDWPPTVKPKSSTGSGKRGNGEATRAAQGVSGGSVPGTRMVASPDTDNHTPELVHVVGVDDPLIHRFAEELSENGESAKVRGYLMSSVHDNYDYQVGNS